MTWVQPKFSSLDQMSFTLTGLLVTCRGGSLVGKKNSLTRYPNPPKLAPQFTASLLLSGPLGAGRELRKSFRLSLKCPPYSSGMSGESRSPLTLIGFSVRNCLRLDQKPSVTTRRGTVNVGTSERDADADCCGRDAGALGLLASGGSRFINEPGNVFP